MEMIKSAISPEALDVFKETLGAPKVARNKPILCLDFDGVIHSYASGWKGADVVPDPPTDGAMRFIWDASEHFRVSIFSSRSRQRGGKGAMQKWLRKHFTEHWASDRTRCDDILAEIEWPEEKPPAMLTIDDRALTFTGRWSDFKMETLLAFQPWNKRIDTIEAPNMAVAK